VPGPGGGGGGSQRSKKKKLSKLPRIYENSQFLALFALKIAENALFFLKYLTKCTIETFFEEYINFN
jgi:hypothetical protein